MASYAAELPDSTPPVLPPKPGSHEASRIATPASAALPVFDADRGRVPGAMAPAPPPSIPDPGENWLPQFLQDKSYVFTPFSLPNDALFPTP